MIDMGGGVCKGTSPYAEAPLDVQTKLTRSP